MSPEGRHLSAAGVTVMQLPAKALARLNVVTQQRWPRIAIPELHHTAVIGASLQRAASSPLVSVVKSLRTAAAHLFTRGVVELQYEVPGTD